MSTKKELEQSLRLTDEMILIQGIVLIEQGARLMKWHNIAQLDDKLDALEGLIYELVKECTQTGSSEAMYIELSCFRS